MMIFNQVDLIKCQRFIKLNQGHLNWHNHLIIDRMILLLNRSCHLQYRKRRRKILNSIHHRNTLRMDLRRRLIDRWSIRVLNLVMYLFWNVMFNTFQVHFIRNKTNLILMKWLWLVIYNIRVPLMLLIWQISFKIILQLYSRSVIFELSIQEQFKMIIILLIMDRE